MTPSARADLAMIVIFVVSIGFAIAAATLDHPLLGLGMIAAALFGDWIERRLRARRGGLR